MKTLRYTHKITNSHLLEYPTDWFPIRQDGEVTNMDEFISLKMRQYNLRTRGPVLRALQTVGY